MTATTNHPVYTAPTGLTTTISRTLNAEWTKFRTLPSTWRMTVIAIVTSIGLGVILCVSQAGQWVSMSASQRRSFDPTACSLGGVFLVGVALLTSLAVRSVTAEYASGMIRSTFIATPTRRLVLAAKAVVSAAFIFPVVLLCNLISFEAGQRVFTAKHLQVSFGHPGVLQAIVFGAVGVSLVAILGVGVGGIIRHTAGATTALIMVVVGGVTLGQFLPAGLRQYLPGTALEAAVTVHRSAGLLTPKTAIVVLGIYAATALGAASIRISHRDA